jgi:hypothetical protein
MVNTDTQTGISYGIISANSLMPEALDTVLYNGRDLGYEAYVKERASELASEWRELLDQVSAIGLTRACDATDEQREQLPMVQLEGFELHDVRATVSHQYLRQIAKQWAENEDYFNDGPTTYYYCEPNGLALLYDTDSNYVTVLSSPLVALCAECSPCYPNAGDLDTQGCHEAYALPLDWFDDEFAPCPYGETTTMEERRRLRRCARLAKRIWEAADFNLETKN